MNDDRPAPAFPPPTADDTPAVGAVPAYDAPLANSLLQLRVGGQARGLPLSPAMEWLAEALGTLARGGSYLLAGPPGSRKSGLATQLALDVCRWGGRALYVATEEPAERLRERAATMTGDWYAPEARLAMANLQVETGLTTVGHLPEFLRRHVLAPQGRYHGVELVVVDSVHGQGLPSTALTRYERLYEGIDLAASAGITLVLICHVTKRSEVAGPRTLEHKVDALLVLRPAMGHRMLFVPKNRFGPALLRDPLPLVLDPVSLTLCPAARGPAVPAVARSYLGAGTGGVLELQCSVALSLLGGRGRVLSPGLPRREVEQLLECVGRLPGVDVDALYFSVNVRVPGGGRRYREPAGLALAMALLGGYLRRPIPDDVLYLGEVDLCGAVREVSPQVAMDLHTTLMDGAIPTPIRLFVPPGAAMMLPFGTGGEIEVRACRRLEEAMCLTWPELG